jgi:hypothetical protein
LNKHLAIRMRKKILMRITTQTKQEASDDGRNSTLFNGYGLRRKQSW